MTKLVIIYEMPLLLLIIRVNIYLNENQEKVWNEFNDFTYSQRIEYLINFYISHNKSDKDNNSN